MDTKRKMVLQSVWMAAKQSTLVGILTKPAQMCQCLDQVLIHNTQRKTITPSIHRNLRQTILLCCCLKQIMPVTRCSCLGTQMSTRASTPTWEVVQDCSSSVIFGPSRSVTVVPASRPVDTSERGEGISDLACGHARSVGQPSSTCYEVIIVSSVRL